MGKRFCFTVDDNIRCLRELTEGTYASIFDQPYLGMYRRLHEKYGLKVQLNLFYRSDDFDLSRMTDRYKDEWKKNSNWLKLSFHSDRENVKPYEHSGYNEVFEDCQSVHREIVRFASPDVLGKTTTVHYCLATDDGLRALKDNGVAGLLGLYGNESKPRTSYQSTPEEATIIRRGETVVSNGIAYAAIDIVLNSFSKEDILSLLEALAERSLVKIMIHEQYFYPDYPHYQSNFEEKISAAFDFLGKCGFESIFFEESL